MVVCFAWRPVRGAVLFLFVFFSMLNEFDETSGLQIEIIENYRFENDDAIAIQCGDAVVMLKVASD